MTYEEIYNSACGIVGQSTYEDDGYRTAVDFFEEDLRELENNQDFTFFGHFDMTQDADEELEYQGFTLDEITKMSMNRYGNVIECLKAPDSETYWVFIGSR